MTARWMPTLLTIALLLVGSGYGPTAEAAPLASSPDSTRHLLLSDDLLDRMMAVARERQAMEQAHPANDDDEDDSGDGANTRVPTMASMGKRMDADPATHALLARHGFTGQSYLLAMSTLARAGAQARMAGTKWASRMPGAASVDPRNIRFYEQHSAKIAALNALNNPDYSPEDDERMTRQLRNIDPEDMDDCVLLVPSVVSLTPHAMPGSSESPPSTRIELANATARLAEHFHAEQLKKDFTLMADEIRRHAYAKRMDSAPFDNALGRVKDWAAARCKGDEK